MMKILLTILTLALVSTSFAGEGKKEKSQKNQN